MRLGEIGNGADLGLSIKAFEDQSYNNAIEAIPGVKYFCLESIGEIGGPDAEKFLREVTISLSKNIMGEKFSFTWADTLMTLGVALRGLGAVGTVSSGALLDTIFRNTEIMTMMRSIAYLGVLKIELKYNSSLTNSSDTAIFLIDKWKSIPWAPNEFTANGPDSNFFMRNDIESLIYQYRSITYPYVLSLINEMNSNDPKLSALRDLKNRMEANPPK
jgi:hypothetical protein